MKVKNLKHFIKIINAFINCKSVIIIGLDEGDNLKNEFSKVIKKTGFKSDDVKYAGINIKARTFIFSKKLSNTLKNKKH